MHGVIHLTKTHTVVLTITSLLQPARGTSLHDQPTEATEAPIGGDFNFDRGNRADWISH